MTREQMTERIEVELRELGISYREIRYYPFNGVVSAVLSDGQEIEADYQSHKTYKVYGRAPQISIPLALA